ncbi:hypothetical protein AB0912_15715 [Streptomyces sp. NPDC007084]|uniref:hypothetical protein n=1 Tax=Streptomyces sp. NPDC007084 TaxID=3154313 RepID=UPI003455D616
MAARKSPARKADDGTTAEAGPGDIVTGTSPVEGPHSSDPFQEPTSDAPNSDGDQVHSPNVAAAPDPEASTPPGDDPDEDDTPDPESSAKICTRCFPGGWQPTVTAVGCEHGNYQRTADHS